MWTTIPSPMATTVDGTKATSITIITETSIDDDLMRILGKKNEEKKSGLLIAVVDLKTVEKEKIGVERRGKKGGLRI
jgi:hypothetical protein